MAVHVVLVARIRIVMDPRVKPLRIEEHFSLFYLVSGFDHIDDLYWHKDLL